jgi:hypothetical protein
MEGPFSDPDIPHGERTAYRGLVGDDEAGTGEVTVERASEDGRDVYRQVIVARVRDAADVRAETVFRRRSGQIHAESHRMETGNGDGAPVATEEARFRDVKVLAWGGEVESFPRDVAPLLACGLALRGLEFEQGAERSFSVWLVNAIHWQVDAKVEKRERIDIAAGKLDAWRVRLRPSFEQVDRTLDKVIDAVMPPVVAHFAAEAPHRLLRLQFPTGPFKWNPIGLIEAIEIDGADT